MTTPAHPQRCETCKKRLINNPEDCPAEIQYEELLETRISVSDIELLTSIVGCASHSSQSRDQVLDEVIAFLKSKQSLSPLTDTYYGAAIKEIDTELRRRI